MIDYSVCDEYFDKLGIKHIVYKIIKTKDKESKNCTCYLSEIKDLFMKTIDKNGLCICCKKERAIDLFNQRS